MRRAPRYLPSAFVLTAAFALFAVGCDLINKKDEADAGPVAVTPVPTVVTTDAGVVVPATATTPAPPLNPAAPVVTPGQPGQPTLKTDGGGAAVADSGAKTDGAAPAPAPLFPGFDAGQLQAFDAGGLFKVTDGGFKPPWQK